MDENAISILQSSLRITIIKFLEFSAIEDLKSEDANAAKREYLDSRYLIVKSGAIRAYDNLYRLVLEMAKDYWSNPSIRESYPVSTPPELLLRMYERDWTLFDDAIDEAVNKYLETLEEE